MLLLATCFSCSDMVEGINDDPNSLTSSSYGNILTGAEVGNIILQAGETARRAGIFAGQYTGIDRQHLGYSQYNLTTSDFDGLWYNAYVNALRNAKLAEQVATDNEIGPITIGITQVLQAYISGTIASLYGDSPYEEAGQVEISDPVYQDQLEIYAGIQTALDVAIMNLQAGTGRPLSGSELYADGNPTVWTQVAYTLKARFYMHTKQYAEAYASALNGINSASNSLYAPAGTAADNSNLNYQFFAVETRQADLVVSDFMASLIQPGATNPIPENYRGNSKTDETARYNFYFTKTSVGIQPNTSTGFASQTAPTSLVTYQENLLILAEAGLRSQGFSTGLDYLNQFREFMNGGGYLFNIDAANLKYQPYTTADFQAGGIENPGDLSSDDALLREILQERYITLFGQIEPFNDTRRTAGQNTVRVPVQPNVGNSLPERFLYPQTEIDRNNNVPQPIPDLFQPTEVNQ